MAEKPPWANSEAMGQGTPPPPWQTNTTPEKRGVIEKLVGIGGPRYQTWPERALRGVYQDIKGAVQSAETTPIGHAEEMAGPVTRAALDVGAGASRIPRLAAAKPMAAPETEELLGGFGEGFKSSVADIPIKPQKVKDLKTDILAALEAAPHRDYLAPSVYRAVKEMKPITAEPSPMAALGINTQAEELSTVADVELVRRLLGNVPFDQRAAAGLARQKINEFLADLKPSDVEGGANVGEVLQRIRGNYAAGMRASRIEESLDKAQRRAERSGSGANFINTSRQEIDNLLNDKKFMQGVSTEEEQAMREIVKGSRFENIARIVSKLGPKHPLSGWFSAILAAAKGGDLMGAASLGLGHIAQTFAERSSQGKINALQELMRRRSPLYRERAEQAGIPLNRIMQPNPINPSIYPLLMQLGRPQEAQ